MQMSYAELWSHMGWFARGIVFTLLLMSIFSLTVAAVKWIRFRRATNATRTFAPQFSAMLLENDITGAVELADASKNSHVARVLGESLREVVPFLEGNRHMDTAIVSVERSIEREQILLATELKSGLAILATVGATAPFVGLLGTTVGVVNAFSGMSTGGAGIEAISAGIAEALIATAIGLLAAIPAVWLYTRLETLFSELAYAGRELVDWMLTRQATQAQAGD